MQALVATSRTQSDQLFREAAGEHSRTVEVFEAARTDLLHGEHLRRTRRPRDTREPLHRALATFDQIALGPWADRARRELEACGDRVGSHPSADRPALTAQETRVAIAVADGMTNAEVGQALFLSVKTVEFHLGAVYRKLGVRSRGGLAKVLAQNGVR